MSVSAPSLTDHVADIAAGAHVTAARWLKGTLALALADGGVLLARAGATETVPAHPDSGILVAAGDGDVGDALAVGCFLLLHALLALQSLAQRAPGDEALAALADEPAMAGILEKGRWT